MVGLTLEDPRIIHARQNQEKIPYWKDIECSNGYPVDDWINKLSSHYPSFIVYSTINIKPRFHEKHGWWLGVISTIIIGVIFGMWGYYQQYGF